ncbi:MAG: hypothetical protein AAGG44_17625, partial [Planctomycetota bacterium]
MRSTYALGLLGRVVDGRGGFHRPTLLPAAFPLHSDLASKLYNMGIGRFSISKFAPQLIFVFCLLSVACCVRVHAQSEEYPVPPDAVV